MEEVGSDRRAIPRHELTHVWILRAQAIIHCNTPSTAPGRYVVAWPAGSCVADGAIVYRRLRACGGGLSHFLPVR